MTLESSAMAVCVLRSNFGGKEVWRVVVEVGGEKAIITSEQARKVAAALLEVAEKIENSPEEHFRKEDAELYTRPLLT